MNKEKAFTDALRVAVLMESKEKGVTRLRLIADRLATEAESGNVVAIKEIADRLDGRATQQLDVDANLRVTHDQWIERLQLPGSKE